MLDNPYLGDASREATGKALSSECSQQHLSYLWLRLMACDDVGIV